MVGDQQPLVEPEGFRQLRYRPPAGAARLTVVRHGESQAAHPDRPFPLTGGHGDPPLHPEGERQAELLGARLAAEHQAGERIAAIYVTTLQRTVQTAAPLVRRTRLEPRVEPDLREVHLGEWEGGMLRSRAAAGDPLLRRMLDEERWDVIPGAEPLLAFEERLRSAIDRIAAAHPDERVVVVAHGGVIGHLMHMATGASRFAFGGTDNASVTELVVLGDRWVVRSYNDVAHLGSWGQNRPTG